MARLLLYQSRSMHTPTVFLVEDESTLRSLVRNVLERYGCKVIEASSGEMALKKWSEKKAKIDLLLTDLLLADGINGRELADTLLSDNPHLKVVFTTGYSYDEVCKGLPLPEGYHFLQKPYPPLTLIQTIKNALRAPLDVAA